MLFDRQTRQASFKVVFYGPPGAGKRTSVRTLCMNLPGELRSYGANEMSWMAMDHSPFICFELRLGGPQAMTTVAIHTLSDFGMYPETRRSILRGADAIVFVADSDESRRHANLKAFNDLHMHLEDDGENLADIPHVIQCNKRDLPCAMPLHQMENDLNRFAVPMFATVSWEPLELIDTYICIFKSMTERLLAPAETLPHKVHQRRQDEMRYNQVSTLDPPAGRSATRWSANVQIDADVKALVRPDISIFAKIYYR